MKKVFSGVKPSGEVHLGNYLGAIKLWVKIQDEVDESIFCVVDLHAITVPQDPKELQKNILSVAALYIACGVDLNKSTIFVQSARPEHSELAWLLNCTARVGELNRMTQFKEKAGTNQKSVSVGLFDYPVLMAADILLYNTTHVPVGEDQKQHVELTRNLALRFNKRYGDTFILPEPVMKKEVARIMSLDNPLKKMDKSSETSLNYIAITDDAETIRNKIKKAVTDSGGEVKAGEDKPAITNLISIYSEISGMGVNDIESKFSGKGYGEFKDALTEELINHLNPIQKKYDELIHNENELHRILTEGAEKLAPIAQKTLAEVKNKIGLGI